MDKKLVIDNKKYLSSIYAGKISGYTNDYIARLARQRKILGKKIGKTWYIEECSLQDFIKGNKIQKTQSAIMAFFILVSYVMCYVLSHIFCAYERKNINI